MHAGCSVRVVLLNLRVEARQHGCAVRIYRTVLDIRVGVCEREQAREAVAREVALLHLQLDAFATLVAGVETRDEAFLGIEEELLNLVLRLPQERRHLPRQVGTFDVVLPRKVVVDRGLRLDGITRRVAAVLQERRADEVGRIFLPRAVLLEGRIAGFRIASARESE